MQTERKSDLKWPDHWANESARILSLSLSFALVQSLKLRWWRDEDRERGRLRERSVWQNVCECEWIVCSLFHGHAIYLVFGSFLEFRWKIFVEHIPNERTHSMALHCMDNVAHKKTQLKIYVNPYFVLVIVVGAIHELVAVVVFRVILSISSIVSMFLFSCITLCSCRLLLQIFFFSLQSLFMPMLFIYLLAGLYLRWPRICAAFFI